VTFTEIVPGLVEGKVYSVEDDTGYPEDNLHHLDGHLKVRRSNPTPMGYVTTVTSDWIPTVLHLTTDSWREMKKVRRDWW